jgi:hypothetical protein
LLLLLLLPLLQLQVSPLLLLRQLLLHVIFRDVFHKNPFVHLGGKLVAALVAFDDARSDGPRLVAAAAAPSPAAAAAGTEKGGAAAAAGVDGRR